MAYIHVDLEAAFDSLDRNALWLILDGIGTPPKLLAILRVLYITNTTSRIRAYGLTYEPFSTSSGVRQSCVAAPSLFNVAIDYWLGRTLDRCPDIGSTYHHRFTDLYYADDVALFANLLDTFADALETLSLEASPLGLTIS